MPKQKSEPGKTVNITATAADPRRAHQ